MISRFTDTMLKNKVVHISTIHGKTFEIPPIFFQQANCNFIAKGNSSSYNNLPVLLGKKSPFASMLPTFIQKGKNGWAAQSDLWASQPFAFPTLHFSKLLQKILH